MDNEKDFISANVIDALSGEILDSFHEGDCYRKVTNDQREYVDSHVMDFKKGESFVKLYDDVIPVLMKQLTPAEIMFVLRLANYVSYEDCVLRKDHRHNGEVMNAKDLAEELNMKESTVRRLISSLKNKGIITVHNVGSILPEYYGKYRKVITVNPYIYFRGNNVNKTVLTIYEKTGWNNIIEESCSQKQ